jgi:hypothetical protein
LRMENCLPPPRVSDVQTMHIGVLKFLSFSSLPSFFYSGKGFLMECLTHA